LRCLNARKTTARAAQYPTSLTYSIHPTQAPADALRDMEATGG